MSRLRVAFSIAVAALAIALTAAAPAIVVTGQLLAYQDGFVFFTTGDGFRLAPGVAIRNADGSGPAAVAPAPRIWARAHFDPNGTVTELDLSRTKLPPEGNFADVARYAVALSSPIPNPDLMPATPAPGKPLVPSTQHFSGKPVLVTFTVQVPPNTAFSASVYITTDASGWNPQAIPMDRTDSLHYQITRRLNSGTVFRYLYDRGSFQAVETAENGLQREPRAIVVTDADVRVVRDTVYAWVDALQGGANGRQPNGLPTPYNPAPFPNLPGGFPSPGIPTPHAGKPPAGFAKER
ncbi:MAG TPA: hypothetical protein VFU90_06120 [Candidatus Tumulicola sp.]|nr:hypothetical protein [Candidatus Tumulicola sp.]